MKIVYGKLSGVVATWIIIFAADSLLSGSEVGFVHPMQTAMWGATGTAVLLYWPRNDKWQIAALCWLIILLYGTALIGLAGTIHPDLFGVLQPSSATMLVLITIPFFLVMIPFAINTLRAARLAQQNRLLEISVLAATDPLNGPAPGAMEKALRLLARGTNAGNIADAMVARDEDFFEAIREPHPQALTNTLILLPLLAAAHGTITQQSLDSARYNCPVSMQQELRRFRKITERGAPDSSARTRPFSDNQRP